MEPRGEGIAGDRHGCSLPMARSCADLRKAFNEDQEHPLKNVTVDKAAVWHMDHGETEEPVRDILLENVKVNEITQKAREIIHAGKYPGKECSLESIILHVENVKTIIFLTLQQ